MEKENCRGGISGARPVKSFCSEKMQKRKRKREEKTNLKPRLPFIEWPLRGFSTQKDILMRFTEL
jgi:hypothetical protein